MSVKHYINGKLNLIAGGSGGECGCEENTFTGTMEEVQAAIAAGEIKEDFIIFVTDDATDTTDVLNTYEEIMNNTEENKLPGALGVKEGFEILETLKSGLIFKGTKALEYDFNEIKDTGYYVLGNIDKATNRPSNVTSSGFLIILNKQVSLTNTYILQLIFMGDGSSTYRLTFNNGETWIGWFTKKDSNNLNTSGNVSLTIDTDYICPCDGYFRIIAPTSSNGMVMGYVDGIILMKTVNSGVSSHPDVSTVFVKKGAVLKFTTLSTSTGSQGLFIPFKS